MKSLTTLLLLLKTSTYKKIHFNLHEPYYNLRCGENLTRYLRDGLKFEFKIVFEIVQMNIRKQCFRQELKKLSIFLLYELMTHNFNTNKLHQQRINFLLVDFKRTDREEISKQFML